MADHPWSKTRVGWNLYRDSQGFFHQHVRLHGKRTWRKLHSLTLKQAQTEIAVGLADHGRSALGLVADPYRKQRTVKEILDRYKGDRFPDRWGQPRPARTVWWEQRRYHLLREQLGDLTIEQLTLPTVRAWAIKRGANRAAELDLVTLSNACRHSVTVGVLKTNPLASHGIKFRRKSTVVHCREFMPTDAAELHRLARVLLEHKRSVALGWQMLVEAMTGLRTSEALRLRIDAKPGQPGAIEGNHLWVGRSKAGVNPYCDIHPGLAACIKAHRTWHRTQPNPFWFPHRLDRKLPVDKIALTHALQRTAKALGLPPRTSHGLRAYFVTVRRSQGIHDGQIAAEIGDSTGGSIISSTYGAIPPNWSGRPGLTWLPKGKPAWTRGEPAGEPKAFRKKPATPKARLKRPQKGN